MRFYLSVGTTLLYQFYHNIFGAAITNVSLPPPLECITYIDVIAKYRSLFNLFPGFQELKSGHCVPIESSSLTAPSLSSVELSDSK